MASTYALFVTASFHDQIVEEQFVRTGRPLQIGNSEAMGLPVPDGMPYLATIEWVDSALVRVTDGREQQYLLDPDNNIELDFGGISLRLHLARQFALKRIVWPSWKGSIAWATVLLMSLVVAEQGRLLWEMRCEWFGICPQAEVAEAPVGVNVTAEYLARLLREDYAGDEQGVIEKEIDRPDAERVAEAVEHFYMPAGADGPITEMGGAKETAPEPIRTPPQEQELPLPSQKSEDALVFDDPDAEIELSKEVETDGVAELDLTDDGDDAALDEVEEPPAEEEEGWGIPDWYDERDSLMEKFEIELVLRNAMRRIAIDPEDQLALSILSYYQYLAQDYDAAMRTYEKYIQLWPDEPAGYNNMALIHKRRGEYEREERLYRVALALQPDDPTALNNLGVNLAHQGRFEEALSVMERLQVLDPDDAYADLHRAKIYAEMGQDEKALEYLEKALQGMRALDTLHHIEFRQDIRLDPSFEKLRQTREFRAILYSYYGKDSPLQE